MTIQDSMRNDIDCINLSHFLLKCSLFIGKIIHDNFILNLFKCLNFEFE